LQSDWGERWNPEGYTDDGFGTVTKKILTEGAVLCLLTVGLIGDLTAQQQVGFIHGTVLDPAGAVLVGLDVEVSSPEHVCKTTSNNEGKFNCQLPPGRYRVVVSGQGLMPYRRATVNVAPSAHVFLKLRPVLRAAPIGVDSVPPAVFDFPDPKISYEEQTVGNTDVLLQYASSAERGGQITFTGPHLVLTIDAITVHADEMTCSNPIRTCRAKGSVIAEVGQEELSGTGLELDVSTRKFVLTRDPNVVRTF